MSCAKFEPLIALYVESDLPERERRLVDAHLESCPSCREFDADIRESQTALKELRMDFVEESALHEVRAAVLNQLSIPRKTVAWPKYAVAAMLLIGLWAAGWLWRAHTLAPLDLQPIAALIAPPPLATVPPPQRSHTTVVRHRPPLAPRFQSEPLVVKMITDDPQVVIYWLVSQNGG
jgi:anti-sigma factor RsiW